MLKVKEHIKSWYNEGGKEKIAQYMVDEDGIFTSSRGFSSGVYVASVVIPKPEKKEIMMYIGEVGQMDRGFRDRLVELAKYWIDNSQFYTGLSKEELEKGYKYKVCILAEEPDHEKRKALKQAFIEEYKPYIQFNCYPKFQIKNDYRGYDLAIFPTYRRRAFLVARDGKYTDEPRKTFVSNIFDIGDTVDWKKCRAVNSYLPAKDLVVEEMPKGSEMHIMIKEYVERKMGIISPRGCRYDYLVKVVAAALEPFYTNYYKEP